MKISVIIPSYNRAEFLLKSIQSILNQGIKINEIVVVDDGSTDNTQQILQKFDINYIYQDNTGVSSARNTGIKAAQNDWICFLDSDDIWHNDKIEKQIQYHIDNPNIYFSYTDEKWVYNNKEIKQKNYQKKRLENDFLNHIDLCRIGASSCMIHKSIFDDIGFFDEDFKACEDYDLWLRILRKYKVGYIDEKLITKISGHKGQLSFETVGIDYYRILALKKHINSKYNELIINEITKKREILLKGAKKYGNHFYIEFCESLVN